MLGYLKLGLQVVMLITLYGALAKVGLVFAGVMLIAHVSYELVDMLQLKQQYKEFDRQRKEVYDDSFGGHC